MGTINYQSGDIITLGLNLDFEIKDIEQLAEDWGCSTEDAEYEEKQLYTEDAMNISQEIIDDINTEIEDYGYFEKWIDIKLVEGYYEGFSVVVNKNYVLDGIEEDDKQEIVAELEEARKGLKRLTDTYLDVCYPWWCTRFEEGRKENHKAIDNAIDATLAEL